MNYSREGFAELYPEMLPLTVKHYHEIAWRIEDIPLEVDVDKYCMLEEQGILFCFACRDKAKLVGYAAFILHPHLHYLSTKFASNDVIFLEKDYRGSRIGMDFLNFCEEELKALGAKVIAIRIKHCLDWSGMTARMGYEAVETTHLKWLGD